MKYLKLLKNQKGGALLVMMLIISAIVLIIAITVNLKSVNDLKTGARFLYKAKADNLTKSCIEDIILGYKRDPNYSVTTITLPEGSCSVTINNNGNFRTIAVSSAVNNYYSNIEIIVDLSQNPVMITSWTRT